MRKTSSGLASYTHGVSFGPDKGKQQSGGSGKNNIARTLAV
ncbi:hypothetical protein ACPOL_5284 [Acidisarcina polymorpha]|uniref:Uncharacterized protein n=1 Tax=Acidisarcina polymorpha TaxID=2211140 RepID=A0A2Z5G7J5_9BACT|nr:hypothetical protein ACPOL_5284 [Acidisarcina polymorpha]